MLRYYHYRSLSPAGQAAYKTIVLSLKKFSSCAVIDSVENLQTVLEAAKNLNLDVPVEYITDLKIIMDFGVMTMPAIVINETVVTAGKVLKTRDVEKLLRGFGN